MLCPKHIRPKTWTKLCSNEPKYIFFSLNGIIWVRHTQTTSNQPFNKKCNSFQNHCFTVYTLTLLLNPNQLPSLNTERTNLNQISNSQTLTLTLLLSNISESPPKHVTVSAVNLTESEMFGDTGL